ncbi:hypothetical protein RhiirB3_409691, partial [Rhizophagus irregularis]
MLQIKCNIIWFENLVTRMKLYNYYDVLRNFTKTILHFVQLKYMFAIILLLVEISKKECWHLTVH